MKPAKRVAWAVPPLNWSPLVENHGPKMARIRAKACQEQAAKFAVFAQHALGEDAEKYEQAAKRLAEAAERHLGFAKLH